MVDNIINKNNLNVYTSFTSQKNINSNLYDRLNNNNKIINFKYVQLTSKNKYTYTKIYSNIYYKGEQIVEPLPKPGRANKKRISNTEQNITNFCSDYYPIYQSVQDIVSSELDIFIRELSLGIECHGERHHSEEELDKYYGNGYGKMCHLKKYLMCKSKGIKLLQIFDEEYKNKTVAVETLLINEMKNNKYIPSTKFFTINKIEDSVANTFLSTYHIKGYVEGLHFGIINNHELLYMITVKFNNDEIELLRFTNKKDILILNGLKNILNYVLNNYNKNKKYKKIIFKNDLRFCQSSILLSAGFKITQNKIIDPQFFKKIRDNQIFTIYDAGYTEYILCI